MVFDVKKNIKLRMRGKIIIPQKTFRNIVKLSKEFDSIVETIEIMNDRELMKGIERSRTDFKKGRFRELKNMNEIDKMLG